jgi:hypothetical protein
MPPAEQLALEFSPALQAEQDWPAIMEDLQAVVRHLTLKNAAFECAADPTGFRDALHERERKGPRLKWLHVMCAMAKTDPEARAALKALIGKMLAQIGCEVVDLPPKMDAAERLRRLEAELEEKLSATELAKLKRQAWGGR